jgi:hypothetical protein
LIFVCCSSPREEGQEDQAHATDRCSRFAARAILIVCVLAGSVDDALDVYVGNETPSALTAVVDAVMHKMPRYLARGLAMQLLEAVHQQYEQAEMEAEDASLEAATAATKHAFKRIADAVLAASPAN